MAKYRRFEEVPVWNDAARLYNLVADFLELPGVRLTQEFRSQLDAAALSISNNIAEGFDRTTGKELVYFLGIARGSAAEVRSMLVVAEMRPGLKKHHARMEVMREMADSCGRQLWAWAGRFESDGLGGRRSENEKVREGRRAQEAAREFRLAFYRSLKPDHALYGTEEARRARGEKVDEE